jgi:NAD(P)-dependent dehydrogenase (short-subunit alcohol dehydrogenase family)
VKLNDKTVIITGAGSGVGRSSALLFAQEGARVVIADIVDDWAKETLRQVGNAQGTALAVHCDVTDEAQVESAIATAVREFGRLDIMFNNAGVTSQVSGQPLIDIDGETFTRLVDINLRGVFHGCKHAIKQFTAQGDGGVIVNTGSVAGMVGFGNSVYGATKGAVNQLTRAVAVEVADKGIRCNAICPGAMPLTNFTMGTRSEAFETPDEDYVNFVASLQPNGRVLTAEDCARAALFLASDDSSSITGVLLPVDGGFTAR